jgi:hypothetical protein
VNIDNSGIPNGPDCDRSVEITEISYDVSLEKIVMSKWSGTVTLEMVNTVLIQPHWRKEYDFPDYR